MITKTVIPAAGFGTRMLPAAKAIPKEMLPVLDKPTIQYVVEEAAGAGATDVLLIVSRDKKAVEDHFDRYPELEARLQASGKTALIDSVLKLQETIRVHATRQLEQRGLGHAVLQARHHVGDQPFLCCLGDTIFSGGDQTPATLPYCDCQVLLERSFYAPIWDRSWPDDTVVEFDYMDSPPRQP